MFADTSSRGSISSQLIIVVTVIVASFAVQALLSNRAGSDKDVKAIIATTRPAGWHFVALEYCYGFLNRTHVVFVTENMICGARVRGALSAPVRVTARWHDPYFYPRPALVARYERVDLESTEFVAISRANFQLRKDQVTAVEFTIEPKWGMGNLPYTGRLLLSLKDGPSRELILLGTQNGPLLRARLIAAGFGATADNQASRAFRSPA